MSIDPVTFLDTGSPGMFNRYAYTFNDPINLIDPTGMAAKVTIYGMDTTGFSKKPTIGHSFVAIEDTESNRASVLRAGSVNGAGISNGGASSLLTSGSESSGSDGAGGIILTQVDAPLDRPDVQSVISKGLETSVLAQTTTEGSYDDALSAANSFAGKVNNAAVPYDALSRNSNSTAATAYEQITGESRPDNPPNFNPGFNTDLCAADVEC